MKTLLAGLLLLASLCVYGFELADLQQQMQQAPVVRGHFVQEKHIRGLTQPLTSRGSFCLSGEQGLLWNVTQPLARSIRVTHKGVAHQAEDKRWLPGNAQRQTALFLAVLGGDTAALQQQFELALSGRAEDWQLTLTPKSALLKRIFKRIDISGGALVTQIELDEVSGERTLIRLLEAVSDSMLSDEEIEAFAG